MKPRDLIFPVGCFVWVEHWNSTDKFKAQILLIESAVPTRDPGGKPHLGAHVLTEDGYVQFISMSQIARWNKETVKEAFAQ